jgi:hypothetical protein
MTEAARAGCVMLAVLGGAALSLRAADAIPAWLTGVPRGVHACATLAEAEARTGLRLTALGRKLGEYRIEPGGIRTARKSALAVAVAMRGCDRGATPLTFFRSSVGEIPILLREPMPSFHEVTVPLPGGRVASLRAATLADGALWQDLEWSEGEGRAALRFSGRTVDLLRLGRQLVEDAP